MGLLGGAAKLAWGTAKLAGKGAGFVAKGVVNEVLDSTGIGVQLALDKAKREIHSGRYRDDDDD